MEKPSYRNFDKDAYPWRPDVDYRERPELYRVGEGEQGVLIREPYKGELAPLWRFKTPAVARSSSAAIYKRFLAYLRAGDFVGADMARKFPQMGFTRARRYANYKGGRKYDSGDKHSLEKGRLVHPLTPTSFEDIHWGLVARSEVQTFRLDDLRTPGIDVETLLENGRAASIGNVGRGSADPSGFAYRSDGSLVVALAGADEVATALGLGRPYKRVNVGRRPAALALSPDGETAYAADSLDDAVSVVDLSGHKVAASISLGPRPAPTLVDEGESLFTSARIGREGWMSCHTCHTDGHTSSVLADTQSDGSYGAAKQTPTLLGVARTGPWTWLGKVDRLEDQVRRSIASTMRGGEPTDRQVEALTAYLRTLELPTPTASAPAEAVARGRALFASRDCASCHAGAEYTSPKAYDVGLADAVGSHAFNPPSLRGVSRRSSLLHDASVRSLPELFERVHHADGGALSPAEVADLVAFLESL